MKKLIVLSAAVLPLVACSTVSFAPPGVEVNYVGYGARPNPCPSGRARNRVSSVTVSPDVAGALKVLDAYIDAYDCNSRAAADGRQAFEVPSQITTTGAVTAAALGAPVQVPILSTAVNSLLMAGRTYYDPKQKAAIYGHALDALHCIQNEAVGIGGFAAFQESSDRKTADQANKALFSGGRTDGAAVTVSAEQQYFIMVTNAARSVGAIALTRLSNAGSFDPAGTAAELEKINSEIATKQDEKKQEAQAAPTGQDGDGKGLLSGMIGNLPDLAEKRRQRMVELDLALLHPKLQACIWRAKV